MRLRIFAKKNGKAFTPGEVVLRADGTLVNVPPDAEWIKALSENLRGEIPANGREHLYQMRVKNRANQCFWTNLITDTPEDVAWLQDRRAMAGGTHPGVEEMRQTLRATGSWRKDMARLGVETRERCPEGTKKGGKFMPQDRDCGGDIEVEEAEPRQPAAPEEPGGGGFGGDRKQIAAEAVARLSTGDIENRGFTFDPVTGRDVVSGYAVSRWPEHEKIIPHVSQLTEDVVIDYLANTAEVFEQNPTASFGGWFDPSNGRIYLDVSDVRQTFDEARQIAILYRQEAFFDLINGRTIRVGAREEEEQPAAQLRFGVEGGNVIPGSGANERGLVEQQKRMTSGLPPLMRLQFRQGVTSKEVVDAFRNLAREKGIPVEEEL